MFPLRFNHILWATCAGLICLASNALADIRIQVPEDSAARMQDSGKSVELPASSPTSLEISAPIIVTSSKRLPVFLIPVFRGETEITIDSPLIETVLRKRNEEDTDQILASTMESLARVQAEIKARRLERASQLIEELERKYPNIKFFEFTRASILLLSGKKNEALAAARLALKAHPNYQEGKRFVEELGGKK